MQHFDRYCKLLLLSGMGWVCSLASMSCDGMAGRISELHGAATLAPIPTTSGSEHPINQGATPTSVATYTSGTIKPSHTDQAQLDKQLVDFYQLWKSRYVSQEGCGAQGYYVKSSDTAGGGMSSSSITVSEAHGYGMMVFVLMAGLDPQAKTYFDGMYQILKAHPSAGNPHLMAWEINQGCTSAPGADSAPDGDLDMAYALLLADKVWGSQGAINYREAGLEIAHAIMQSEVNPSHLFLGLAENISQGDPQYGGSRPSDIMPDHFRAFGALSQDPRWNQLTQISYQMLDSLQRRYSPNYGLVPDFVVHADGTPQPAPSHYIKDEDAGQNSYQWNSCRVPWRLAVDYLIFSDMRAYTLVQRLNAGIRNITGDNPRKIMDGYTLDGKLSQGSQRSHEMGFVAPFAVAAMVHADHQAWLDALWNDVVQSAPQGYYSDSIKLLSMMTVTGHMMAP